MSFDWPDYLELSKELLKRSYAQVKDEALFRCVTSRAYYSLLIPARNHLEDKGHNISKTRVHRDVPELFRNSFNPKERQIAADLDKLRGGREKSDYWNRLDEDPKALANISINIAGRSINNLNRL